MFLNASAFFIKLLAYSRIEREGRTDSAWLEEEKKEHKSVLWKLTFIFAGMMIVGILAAILFKHYPHLNPNPKPNFKQMLSAEWINKLEFLIYKGKDVLYLIAFVLLIIGFSLPFASLYVILILSLFFGAFFFGPQFLAFYDAVQQEKTLDIFVVRTLFSQIALGIDFVRTLSIFIIMITITLAKDFYMRPKVKNFIYNSFSVLIFVGFLSFVFDIDLIPENGTLTFANNLFFLILATLGIIQDLDMVHKLSHRTIAAKNQSLIILGFLVTFATIFSFINVFNVIIILL
ncbi:hypothetical protein [Candidatus Phytoplasma pruni]|uniref:Uncharacterized protein n=1 Tax=Candidatus Phytoplasma pruni TaxID=479893 RepID=A0A851HK02_9MOLU|nr:hypothetical protein [Candidatus Phytoplasma pruni]NWN45769.1 hypothetical protein [Candidatus Phytoplasma pruni]